MTAPTDPPSGRAPDAGYSDQFVDMLEAVQRPQVVRLQAEVARLQAALRDAAVLANLNLRDERDGYRTAAELLQAELTRLTIEHAGCSNLSHAEASRIFVEAQQMRAERDAAREALAASRAMAGDLDMLLAGGIEMKPATDGPVTFEALLMLVQAMTLHRDQYRACAAARPDEPTTEGDTSDGS